MSVKENEGETTYLLHRLQEKRTNVDHDEHEQRTPQTRTEGAFDVNDAQIGFGPR